MQQRLLEVLAEVEPSALYPAALCALADLKEVCCCSVLSSSACTASAGDWQARRCLRRLDVLDPAAGTPCMLSKYMLPLLALLLPPQVAAQDALDAARDSGDAAQLARLLQRRLGDSQELFERAIRLASGGRPATGATNGSIADSEGKAAQEGDGTADGRVYVALRIDDAGGCATVALCLNEPQPQPQPPPPPGQQQQESASNGTLAVAAAAGSRCERSLPGEPGWMWYCHSYLAAYLARRAQFLGSCGEQHWDAAMDTFASALQAASCGAAVLARYRFSPSTGVHHAIAFYCPPGASLAIGAPSPLPARLVLVPALVAISSGDSVTDAVAATPPPSTCR